MGLQILITWLINVFIYVILYLILYMVRHCSLCNKVSCIYCLPIDLIIEINKSFDLIVDADEAEMVALRNKLAALEKKAEMQRRIRALEKELETTPEPSMSNPNRQKKMDKKVEKSCMDVQEPSRKNSLGKNKLASQTHVKIKKEADIIVKKEKRTFYV